MYSRARACAVLTREEPSTLQPVVTGAHARRAARSYQRIRMQRYSKHAGLRGVKLSIQLLSMQG